MSEKLSQFRDVIYLFDIPNSVDQPSQFSLAKHAAGYVSRLLFELRLAHRIVRRPLEVNHEHRGARPIPKSERHAGRAVPSLLFDLRIHTEMNSAHRHENFLF